MPGSYTEKIGADRLIRLTCNPALPNFTLTKFLWVRENEPENWKRVRSVMLPKDYVRFRMTGERAIDVADASGTLLLDVANRRWSREILEAAEMDESMLPRLYESRKSAGNVGCRGRCGYRVENRDAGRRRSGRSGCRRHRAWELSLRARSAPRSELPAWFLRQQTVRRWIPKDGCILSAMRCPERWHVMGVTQAAGLSLRWFRDRFGAGADDGRDPYERLTAEAARVPPGSDGLLWAPYLMGERTPHLDPNARGALIGLTASHTRGHM